MRNTITVLETACLADDEAALRALYEEIERRQPLVASIAAQMQAW
jgi:hypothetical protein